MSSGILVATNHMMNRGDSRVKHLQQSKCDCCTKCNEIGRSLHIMSSERGC